MAVFSSGPSDSVDIGQTIEMKIVENSGSNNSISKIEKRKHVLKKSLKNRKVYLEKTKY